MSSVIEKFTKMTVEQCDAELDRMDAHHKQRMKTLRAFVRAKAAEADTVEDEDEDEVKGDGADEPNGPYTPTV